MAGCPNHNILTEPNVEHAPLSKNQKRKVHRVTGITVIDGTRPFRLKFRCHNATQQKARSQLCLPQ
jgi:hypothetical protein